MAVQQFAEIIVKGAMTAQGSNTINTVNLFHYKKTAGSGASDKPSLVTQFVNTVLGPLAGVLNARWSSSIVSVRWFDDATDPYLDTPTVKPGIITGDSLPPHCALFLLQRTGLRGKSYKGGHHFGPLSESDTTAPTNDILNAAAVTAWNSMLVNLKANLSDANSNVWTPCVLSRKLSQLKTNPTNVVAATVTSVLLNKRIGRLRHREVHSQY